jgi:hypothetical protein
MGRLFKWIRSASASRTDQARKVVPSRRQLRFERCESRIALSTNAGEYLDGFKEEEQLTVHDGGLISLSFGSSPLVETDSFIGTFEALGASDYRDQTFVINAAGSFTIHAEALINIVGARVADGIWSQEFLGGKLVSLGESTLSNNKGFDVPGLTTDGDYNLTLQSPELSSPSVNSDLSVIPAPTPSEQPSSGSNDGGQIALTPFVAPTGLTLSNGHATVGIARAKSHLEELGSGAEARGEEAVRSESLRGRAVVYEVADATTATLQLVDKPDVDAASSDREGIELVSLNALTPASFNKRAQHAADAAHAPTTPAVAEAAVVEGTELPAEVVDFLKAIELSSLNGDDVGAAASHNGTLRQAAAEHDAAFADWGAEGSLAAAGARTASTDNRDRRMLGLGAAVALTFVPLRKAWRRRGEDNPSLPTRHRG